jgi:hypothetical protein
MSNWNSEYHRGKRHLSRGNTELALCSFQKAVKDCPVRNSRELSAILFYTGLALRKLGLTGDAMRSWCAALDLEPGGPSARHIRSYGCILAKTAPQPAGDEGWRDFHAIQLERYLCAKRSHTIGTLAEHDMIEDLLGDAYRGLLASGRLASLDRDALLKEYRSVEIIFPFLLPDSLSGFTR